MTIYKEYQEKTLILAVEGRIDTMPAPELAKEVKDSIEGAEELVFDFEKLEYISSAGLRVLLSAQKTMNKQGSMKVIHADGPIIEIFEVTGFTDILTIE